MWCYNIYYVMSVAEQGYFSMFLLPHESSIPYSMSGVNVFLYFIMYKRRCILNIN